MDVKKLTICHIHESRRCDPAQNQTWDQLGHDQKVRRQKMESNTFTLWGWRRWGSQAVDIRSHHSRWHERHIQVLIAPHPKRARLHGARILEVTIVQCTRATTSSLSFMHLTRSYGASCQNWTADLASHRMIPLPARNKIATLCEAHTCIFAGHA